MVQAAKGSINRRETPDSTRRVVRGVGETVRHQDVYWRESDRPTFNAGNAAVG